MRKIIFANVVAKCSCFFCTTIIARFEYHLFSENIHFSNTFQSAQPKTKVKIWLEGDDIISIVLMLPSHAEEQTRDLPRTNNTNENDTDLKCSSHTAHKGRWITSVCLIMTLAVRDLPLNGTKLYEVMKHEPQDVSRFTTATSSSRPSFASIQYQREG